MSLVDADTMKELIGRRKKNTRHQGIGMYDDKTLKKMEIIKLEKNED